jgi:hypothetical protein
MSKDLFAEKAPPKTKPPQLIDMCLECGKHLLTKPTLIDTKAPVITLCHECYGKLKRRERP